MTTLHPQDPPRQEDPYSNKAIASALTTIVAVGVQWVSTGELELRQEGTTALAGAVATLLVYAVSNWRKLGS